MLFPHLAWNYEQPIRDAALEKANMGIPYRLASFDVGGGGKETKALYFSGLEGLGPSDDAMCAQGFRD